MKSQQFYNLIPVGFVGNGEYLIIIDWMALPEWERALRIDPSGTYCSEGATPANGFTAVQKTAADIGMSADPMGCWIETAIGIDGTSGIDGDPGIAGRIGPTGPMRTVAKILDFATEGSWGWIQGNSSYDNWFTGQSGQEEEDCGMMAGYDNYQWHDVPCSRNYWMSCSIH
jgi:hypothetical protein